MSEHFLTEIEIKEFKYFHEFKAAGFKRVNLIGGKNNIGKTALMEAMFIHVHSQNIMNIATAIYGIKAERERLNISGENFEHTERINLLETTKNYFSRSNLKVVNFYIDENNEKERYRFVINNKKYALNENGLFFGLIDNIYFLHRAGYSSRLISSALQSLRYKENELKLFINEFDSSIENFKTTDNNVLCEINGIYLDITEFGDGLKHYISIICALYACENGYLFIDEIDNGIYYEHFDRLWEIILTLSKQTNCQVFATTHSKEMLESFARVAKKLDEQDISYTLLVKNKKQELDTISLSYKDVVDSLITHDFEVR